jgi:phosphotransacetylase
MHLVKNWEGRSMSMPIRSLRELADAARSLKQKSRIAVVAANDAHTIEAAVNAQQAGIAEVILIGNEALVRERLEERAVAAPDYRIVPADSIEASLAAAVALVHSGEANVLMKGHLETSEFIRTILKQENGLRRGDLLSVAGFYEVPSYHKLFVVSDQAINTYPDCHAKKAIIENAVPLLHAFGVELPKVAVLAAIEKLNPKMRETVDAHELKTLWQKGRIPGCIVDGPLSLDIATSSDAAKIKGYESEVAGDADLLIVPDLVCGNVFAKSLTGFAGGITAGIVVGAKVPVVLTPRSAGASDKFFSIALAAYTARSETGCDYEQ